MMMFNDFYVLENLFKVATLLPKSNHWQKSTKVIILLFPKYHYVVIDGRYNFF